MPTHKLTTSSCIYYQHSQYRLRSNTASKTAFKSTATYFLGKGVFELKYFLLKGPFGDAKIQAEVQRFEFRDDNKESEYHTLMLEGEGECNRLLAARTVNVRLMMFQVKK